MKITDFNNFRCWQTLIPLYTVVLNIVCNKEKQDLYKGKCLIVTAVFPIVTGQKYWCAVFIITVGIAVHPPKNLPTRINYSAATQLRICYCAFMSVFPLTDALLFNVMFVHSELYVHPLHGTDLRIVA